MGESHVSYTCNDKVPVYGAMSAVDPRIRSVGRDFGVERRVTVGPPCERRLEDRLVTAHSIIDEQTGEPTTRYILAEDLLRWCTKSKQAA